MEEKISNAIKAALEAAPERKFVESVDISFTIKDVYDNVDYLASLGKSQTAAVKRDAEIGVAQVRHF